MVSLAVFSRARANSFQQNRITPAPPEDEWQHSARSSPPCSEETRGAQKVIQISSPHLVCKLVEQDYSGPSTLLTMELPTFQRGPVLYSSPAGVRDAFGEYPRNAPTRFGFQSRRQTRSVPSVTPLWELAMRNLVCFQVVKWLYECVLPQDVSPRNSIEAQGTNLSQRGSVTVAAL